MVGLHVAVGWSYFCQKTCVQVHLDGKELTGRGDDPDGKAKDTCVERNLAISGVEDLSGNTLNEGGCRGLDGALGGLCSVHSVYVLCLSVVLRRQVDL